MEVPKYPGLSIIRVFLSIKALEINRTELDSDNAAEGNFIV